MYLYTYKYIICTLRVFEVIRNTAVSNKNCKVFCNFVSKELTFQGGGEVYIPHAKFGEEGHPFFPREMLIRQVKNEVKSVTVIEPTCIKAENLLSSV